MLAAPLHWKDVSSLEHGKRFLTRDGAPPLEIVCNEDAKGALPKTPLHQHRISEHFCESRSLRYPRWLLQLHRLHHGSKELSPASERDIEPHSLSAISWVVARDIDPEFFGQKERGLQNDASDSRILRKG